ncbi:MAG: peroxide stress protein YaaA [Mariprofundaceae bacterium]
MLIVISPAKKLDMDAVVPANIEYSQTPLLEHAQMLIDELREKDVFEISELMKLSMNLADLNVARYQNWQPPLTPEHSKQALWAFRGDVYKSMDVDRFSDADSQFAQQHLRILSGLYGVLRPFDLIQAYRLEMGTKLNNQRGKDLYAFWGDIISQQINTALQQQGDNILINLASQEYFKAVQLKTLNAQVITPVFKEFKNGAYKVIGIYAKRARGLMSRYIIENSLSQPDELLNFDCGGYRYHAELSDTKQLVFTR